MRLPPSDGETHARSRQRLLRFKCPLLVGFTGHRDLVPAELPALEAAVEELLTDVAAAHPHTPLIVLTGLADGADRLAAAAAALRHRLRGR